MKKIVYLLASLIPALAFTSCDDHDDVPDVHFNIEISGGTFSGGSIYVVQGDTLNIDGVAVVNNEQGKGVLIPYVNYYFDYQFVGQNPIEPYGFSLVITDAVSVGRHVLELTAPVYATDKAPGYAVIDYTVNVVESSEDIPADGVQAVESAARVTDHNPSV